MTENPIEEQSYNATTGNESIISSQKIIRIALSSQNGQKINQVLTSKFYELIKGKEFKEYLGIYQYATTEGVSSANKETYRVITFVES